MRNASMKVLKNLVCCAAFICLMFVLAMPAHAASKADELLQLVNAERAQAGVAPLSMGSSALNAAAQARAEELTGNYSYNRPNGSREFTILPEYGVDDVSVGENYWAAAENASDVVAAWNRYDFFKERMLDKDATSVGIGYYEGGEYGNYWVMIFTYARGTSENGFAQEVLALVNADYDSSEVGSCTTGDYGWSGQCGGSVSERQDCTGADQGCRRLCGSTQCEYFRQTQSDYCTACRGGSW